MSYLAQGTADIASTASLMHVYENASIRLHLNMFMVSWTWHATQSGSLLKQAGYSAQLSGLFTPHHASDHAHKPPSGKGVCEHAVGVSGHCYIWDFAYSVRFTHLLSYQSHIHSTNHTPRAAPQGPTRDPTNLDASHNNRCPIHSRVRASGRGALYPSRPHPSRLRLHPSGRRLRPTAPCARSPPCSAKQSAPS